MSFSLDLSTFERKTSVKADRVVRKIVLDVGTRLVMKSPVGDWKYWLHRNDDGSYRYITEDEKPPGYVGGRFRGNWQYGDNQIPEGELPTIDPSGAATNSAIAGAVKVDASGKLHYLVNNLPYARAIEDGHSQRQAPHGVVGLTVIEFQPICSAAAKALQ